MTVNRSVRQASWYLVGILLAALLMAAFAGNGTYGKAAEGEQRKVTVTGMAEMKVSPDKATVNLGVQSQGDTADAATKANNTAMDQVIAVLKKNGISDKDIQTVGLSLYPIQDYEVFPGPDGSARKPAVRGYRADNMVRFSTQNLDGLGALIDQAVSAGANQVHGIEFGLANPQSYEKEAFEKAIAHARSKADMLAKGAGASVGQVLTIEEFGSQPTPFYRNAAIAEDMAAGSVRLAAPIEPGQVNYSLQVRISYALQ